MARLSSKEDNIPSKVPQSVIDSFIQAYERFRLNPNISYRWIPIENQVKTSKDFVIEPCDITVSGSDKPLEPFFAKVQSNTEKILDVFVEYTRNITLSLLGY